MRRITLCLFALVLSMALWPSLNIKAATEDYPGKYLPTVEVKINVGNSGFEDDAFLQAVIDALKTRGVLASKIDVSFAGTIDTDFSVTDPANWNVHGHFGWWEELGGVTSIWNVFKSYVEAHVPGYDSNTMYYNTTRFNTETKSLDLEYYDGTDYQVITYKDLSGLWTRIMSNVLNFKVTGWVDSLQSAAQSVVGATAEAQTLGVYGIYDMYYDQLSDTAYAGWYDSTDYAWHLTPFQAYEDYINQNGFLSALTVNNYGFYDEYGYFGFYDAANDDSFYVYFGPTEYGGVDPSHYPHPDENPDGDQPVDWANDPHIIIRDNGQVVFYGYGAPAYKDFMLSVDDTVSDKHFSFDMDESKVDYHSMEGGGFLFGIAINDQSTGSTDDDTMSGYAVLFTEDGTNLYRLTDVNVKTFHDTEDDEMEYVRGIELIQTGNKDTDNEQHSIKIDVVNNVLTVMDNAVLALDSVTLDVVGNRFGPLVSYASHGCSQLSYFVYDNLKMGTSIKIVSKAQDNVGTVEWTEGAFRVYINLEDTNDTTLVVNDFVAALKADKATYIGIGLNASRAMHDAIVAGNGLGKYFGYEAYPQNLSDMATAIAEYLWPLFEDPTIENIRNVVLDSKVTSDLTNKPVIIIPSGVLDAFDDLKANHLVELLMTINALDLSSVPSGDAALLDAYFQALSGKSAIKFTYLSIKLEKYLDEVLDSEVTSTLKPITIVVTVPEALRGMTTFKIVRVHNGKVEVLPATYDAQNFTLTFTTDRFSTYAIQYTDPNVLPETGEAANWGWIIGLAGLVLVWMTKRSQYE